MVGVKMETATKEKLVGIIQNGGWSVYCALPVMMVCVGLTMLFFMACMPSSAWSSSPAVMIGALNLSAFLVFGGMIWRDVQRVLARASPPLPEPGA